jgi:hypothetical protein
MAAETLLDWEAVAWTFLATTLVGLLCAFAHTHMRWIPAHLVGRNRLSLWLYALFALPGTLLHEFGHLLAALFLSVEVEGFSVYPQEYSEGIVLGYVQFRKGIDSLRHAMVGLAPLLVGLLAISLVGVFAFDLYVAQQQLAAGDWESALQTVVDSFRFRRGWIGAYLIFNVSAGMFPSVLDMRAWPVVAFFGLSLLGFTIVVGLGPGLLSWLVAPLNFVFRWLALILCLTLVVDVPSVLLLTALDEAVGRQFPH